MGHDPHRGTQYELTGLATWRRLVLDRDWTVC